MNTLYRRLCCKTPLKPSKRYKEKLIKVGHTDPSDVLVTQLHHSAYCRNKKSLKQVLDQGIDVDYPNDEGQTPLFCACLAGHESIVKYLLESGADPNKRTHHGLTALHAASYSCYIDILMELLNEGGDMSILDDTRRSVLNWAQLYDKGKKRNNMIQFLIQTRIFAMTWSGQDMVYRGQSCTSVDNYRLRRNSITEIFRSVVGQPSIHDYLEEMANSLDSQRFGQVYLDGEEPGLLSATPVLCESDLKHDPNGATYMNGSFGFQMESVWWDDSQATVKKIVSDAMPRLLAGRAMNEIKYSGQLRHPNVLTLMAVCQTNLYRLIPVYERIEGRSLNKYLYQKNYRLSSQMIHDVAVQICDAIAYIHHRRLVHCWISSHAISVVNSHLFKIGNFEFMTEISNCKKESGKKNYTGETKPFNHWSAPEVMYNLTSFDSDMFSFCAVLWELFHGSMQKYHSLLLDFVYQCGNVNGLEIHNRKMTAYFRTILEHGLQQEPIDRKLSFEDVRDILQAIPKIAIVDERRGIKHELVKLENQIKKYGLHLEILREEERLTRTQKDAIARNIGAEEDCVVFYDAVEDVEELSFKEAMQSTMMTDPRLRVLINRLNSIIQRRSKLINKRLNLKEKFQNLIETERDMKEKLKQQEKFQNLKETERDMKEKLEQHRSVQMEKPSTSSVIVPPRHSERSDRGDDADIVRDERGDDADIVRDERGDDADIVRDERGDDADIERDERGDDADIVRDERGDDADIERDERDDDADIERDESGDDADIVRDERGGDADIEG